MSLAPHGRRTVCATCLRAQSACICRWITPVAHELEVVLLQHPLEVDNAKGSARLLHLSLTHSRLLIGEAFPEHELQAWLSAPLPGRSGARPPWQTILLYPDLPQDAASGVAPSPPLAPACLRDPSRLRLIVLDATWRKSRKMLYLNPLLRSLPRLALRELPASHYLIRRAHRPDQRSTLEATCAALGQLEGDVEKFAPLLAAFDGFVAQQLVYQAKQRPAAVSDPPRAAAPDS